MWDADRSTTVSYTPRELVDGLCFVQAGEAHVIVGAVCSDVLVLIFLELVHELEEVFLAASFAHVVGREVAMHAGTIPIALEGLAVILNIDAILFAEALEDIACDPDLVTSPVGTFAKHLILPLALGDFAVDAFVVDACIEAKVEMFFNDGASDITD